MSEKRIRGSFKRINGMPRNIAIGRLSDDEAKQIENEIKSKRRIGGCRGKERRAEYVRKSMGDVSQS